MPNLQRTPYAQISQRSPSFPIASEALKPTEARKISFEASLLFEKIHAETYTSLGYDLIKIAPESLSERVHSIMEWVGHALDT
jgi:predicted ATPase